MSNIFFVSIMLSSTFLHLPGLSKNGERRLREQNIFSHKDFLKNSSIKGIGVKRKLLLNSLLKEAITPQSLPLSEHWRAFFSTECCYLDCEIDRNGITILTISNGYESQVFIRNRNLFKESIEQVLAQFETIITFNGASFDLPRLHKEFGVCWEGYHIDLKTSSRRLGYVGGLKQLEKELGIVRYLDHKIGGGDPALLYRMWRGSGDESYLKLLIEYNQEDTLNLKRIADYLLPKMKKEILKKKV